MTSFFSDLFLLSRYVKGYHFLMEGIRRGLTISVKNGLQKGKEQDLGTETPWVKL